MPAAVFRQAIEASAPELAKLMPELHRLFPDMAPPLELPPQLRQRYPVHECPGVPDPQQSVHAARHLHRRPAVGGRVDAAADAAPGAAAREPPDRRHRGIPRGGGSDPCCEQGQRSQTCWTGSAVSRAHVLTPQAIKAALDQLVGQRHARAIVLRPFTNADVQSVLAALGQPNPPARLVQKFADHTGGNPFFVAELFRHLKEEGRLFDARQRVDARSRPR